MDGRNKSSYRNLGEKPVDKQALGISKKSQRIIQKLNLVMYECMDV
jgi:hypothetical protein